MTKCLLKCESDIFCHFFYYYSVSHSALIHTSILISQRIILRLIPKLERAEFAAAFISFAQHGQVIKEAVLKGEGWGNIVVKF